ncbi:MAG: AtpZ/AtpI family protein, partial [Myxococcota bacterium]
MLGKALELGIQFGTCVIVGVALGYYLDRWLGTEPVLLLVFMFL